MLSLTARRVCRTGCPGWHAFSALVPEHSSLFDRGSSGEPVVSGIVLCVAGPRLVQSMFVCVELCHVAWGRPAHMSVPRSWPVYNNS